MDVKILDELIEEVKDSDTTYANARDLSALCSARDILTSPTDIEKEIDDILPAYRQYVDIKTRYQLKQIDKESVIYSLNLVCREIEELIQILYSSTDMPLERIEIQNIIRNLYDKYLRK